MIPPLPAFSRLSPFALTEISHLHITLSTAKILDFSTINYYNNSIMSRVALTVERIRPYALSYKEMADLR